jgi:hypothetical protein
MWDQSGKSEREEGETPGIPIVSLGRKPRSQTIGIIGAGLAASSLTPSRISFRAALPPRSRRRPSRRRRAHHDPPRNIRDSAAEGMAEDSSDRILVIPWTPPAPHRRREIIQGEGRRSAAVRPMRAEARAPLIDALRDAYCWQDGLIRDSSRTIESIAAREKKT